MLDRLIPQQKATSTRLGGLLILVGETMFLFSLLNFLMITRIQYYSSNDTLFRTLFPEYTFFLVGMIVVAFIGMWLTYVYIFPSKQKFSQEQAIKDGRSPMYDKLVQMHEEMHQMQSTIDDLQEQVGTLTRDK
ncbi:hypothetical protein [Methanococcoides burtonii]|uniref:Uncharacterized protein n=1 Tax=Methanococcoides burtonii (strain DSM 6242 / NBRC 107633 / OCM 468 / ACE-M) TaxID=259564 RepID=Q12XY1_METBU|nr:hypothetical protein [Methanococcoides burtonii]ABE51695.1 Hypothetical protein Mbur_0730 [Methanococcoides burtonii DSM 6242]